MLISVCSKYMPDVKVKVFFGGIDYKLHKDILAKENPHIVIGTPGRILQLAKDKLLKLGNLKRFVLDECDKMLETLGTRELPSIGCSLLPVRYATRRAEHLQNDSS